MHFFLFSFISICTIFFSFVYFSLKKSCQFLCLTPVLAACMLNFNSLRETFHFKVGIKGFVISDKTFVHKNPCA